MVKTRNINTIFRELKNSVLEQLIDVKQSLDNLIEGHWLRASRLHVLYSKIRRQSTIKELAEYYSCDVNKSFVVSIIYEILSKNNYDISKSTIRSDIDVMDAIRPDFMGLYNFVPITHAKMVITSRGLTDHKKISILRKMLGNPMTRMKLLSELGIATRPDPFIAKIAGHRTIIKTKDEKEAEGILRAAFKVWLATKDSPLGSLTFDDGDEAWEVSESNPFPR